jgi:hypothetical protein
MSDNQPIRGMVRIFDSRNCRSSACKNRFEHEHGDECSSDCECWDD